MKTTTHYTGHRWTDEELKKLMISWANDVPLEEIANDLKSTSRAILHQVQRMRQNGIPLKRRTSGHQHGAKNKPWTQGQIEYLLRRRNERATGEQIAIELGRSFFSIQGMIQKLREEQVDVKMRGNGVRRLWDVESLKAVAIQL